MNKRPHPAERARAITGALSIGGLLGLTGFLAAGHAVPPSGASAVATSSVATPTTPTVTAARAAVPSVTAATTSKGS
jgi:hypothetical protein